MKRTRPTTTTVVSSRSSDEEARPPPRGFPSSFLPRNFQKISLSDDDDEHDHSNGMMREESSSSPLTPARSIPLLTPPAAVAEFSPLTGVPRIQAVAEINDVGVQLYHAQCYTLARLCFHDALLLLRKNILHRPNNNNFKYETATVPTETVSSSSSPHTPWSSISSSLLPSPASSQDNTAITSSSSSSTSSSVRDVEMAWQQRVLERAKARLQQALPLSTTAETISNKPSGSANGGGSAGSFLLTEAPARQDDTDHLHRKRTKWHPSSPRNQIITTKSPPDDQGSDDDDDDEHLCMGFEQLNPFAHKHQWCRSRTVTGGVPLRLHPPDAPCFTSRRSDDGSLHRGSQAIKDATTTALEGDESIRPSPGGRPIMKPWPEHFLTDDFESAVVLYNMGLCWLKLSNDSSSISANHSAPSPLSCTTTPANEFTGSTTSSAPSRTNDAPKWPVSSGDDENGRGENATAIFDPADVLVAASSTTLAPRTTSEHRMQQAAIKLFYFSHSILDLLLRHATDFSLNAAASSAATVVPSPYVKKATSIDLPTTTWHAGCSWPRNRPAAASPSSPIGHLHEHDWDQVRRVNILILSQLIEILRPLGNRNAQAIRACQERLFQLKSKLLVNQLTRSFGGSWQR